MKNAAQNIYFFIFGFSLPLFSNISLANGEKPCPRIGINAIEVFKFQQKNNGGLLPVIEPFYCRMDNSNYDGYVVMWNNGKLVTGFNPLGSNNPEFSGIFIGKPSDINKYYFEGHPDPRDKHRDWAGKVCAPIGFVREYKLTCFPGTDGRPLMPGKPGF